MDKRTVFTTLTPLPPGISRQCVMETLKTHTEMIDLNPLVEERHLIKPPPNATPEEYHCTWYSVTDRVHYLPGGLISGKVTFNVCFHDLLNGLQTHVYAPMGLNIKGKWTLGGNLPGEPIAPVELGVNAPLQGLYLREDVDMTCNFMMTSFTKKTLKKAHAALVERLLVKAQSASALQQNFALGESSGSPFSTPPRTECEFSEYDGRNTVFNGAEQFQSNTINSGGPWSSPRSTSVATFRDGGQENLPSYTPDLNSRSSIKSYRNHSLNSHGDRASYQKSPSDAQVTPTRTLWQNLNMPKKNPNMMNAGFYRMPEYGASEITTQGRLRSTSAQTEVQLPRYNPATYPREFGPVELDAPLRQHIARSGMCGVAWTALM